MLGRGEAAIVARDRDLPGLGLLLDDEAFGERLGTLLPDADVQSSRAVYLRYKPRTSCLVAYRVLGRDGEMDVHALAGRSATPKLAKVGGPLVRLRYKPERRWVGRLTSDAGQGVVLKAHARAGFDAALHGGRAWSDRPPLRVARLVGALPDRRLIAWEWITGRALGEALRAGDDFDEAAGGTIEALLGGSAARAVRPAGRERLA